MHDVAAQQGGSLSLMHQEKLRHFISLTLVKIRAQGLITLRIITSGIATTLLESDRSTYSALKMPLNIHTKR